MQRCGNVIGNTMRAYSTTHAYAAVQPRQLCSCSTLGNSFQIYHYMLHGLDMLMQDDCVFMTDSITAQTMPSSYWLSPQDDAHARIMAHSDINGSTRTTSRTLAHANMRRSTHSSGSTYRYLCC